jgi:phosphatidylserine/phosphatidylglycerophosphate/cardiolipin synthase-like enzyme
MKRVTILLTTSTIFFWMTLSPAVTPSKEIPPTCNWKVYFFPHGGCTDTIIRELNKAKSTVLVQTYSFTSAPIAKALLNAHKRRVKVEVILDKSQKTDQYSSVKTLF